MPTINLDKLNAAGNKITAELERIRESIGADLGDFAAVVETIEIAEADLQRLAAANPGKPIIIGDKLHLTYIKDHSGSWHRKEKRAARTAANGCYYGGNKLHFYYCKTLQDMEDRGRRRRYRQTPAVGGMQTVDLPEKENARMHLAWCQNCISIFQDALPPRPKSPKWSKWYGDKSQTATRGDAETLKKFFQPKNPRWKEFTSELSSAAAPAGYPDNWSDFSARFRKNKKYICAVCRVDCRAHPNLTDAHHINGDKSDCRDENLQCLCKHCHSQKSQHEHYKPSESDMQILQELREEQKIAR